MHALLTSKRLVEGPVWIVQEVLQKREDPVRALTNMGINPNGLKRFVEEKGPLDKQLSSLKRKAGSLKGAVKRLEKERSSLLDKNDVLFRVDAHAHAFSIQKTSKRETIANTSKDQTWQNKHLSRMWQRNT